MQHTNSITENIKKLKTDLKMKIYIAKLLYFHICIPTSCYNTYYKSCISTVLFYLFNYKLYCLTTSLVFLFFSNFKHLKKANSQNAVWDNII